MPDQRSVDLTECIGRGDMECLNQVQDHREWRWEQKPLCVVPSRHPQDSIKVYFDRRQGNIGKTERTAENGDTASARACTRLNVQRRTNKSEAAQLLFCQDHPEAQTSQENISSQDQRAHEHSDIFLCLFVLSAETTPHSERRSAAGGKLPQNCPAREGADPENRCSGRWNSTNASCLGTGGRMKQIREADVKAHNLSTNTSCEKKEEL